MSESESKSSGRSSSRSSSRSRKKSKESDSSKSKKKDKDEKRKQKDRSRSKSSERKSRSSDEKEEKKSKRRSSKKESTSGSSSREEKKEPKTEIHPPEPLPPSPTSRIDNRSIFDLHVLTQNAVLSHEFQQKMTELQFKVNSQLIPKRQMLLNQIMNIQNRITQVRNSKELILRETRDIVDGILARLDQQEKYKVASLERDLMDLQNQLTEIQGFVGKVSSTLEPKGLLGALQEPQLVPSKADTSSMLDAFNFVNMFSDLINECEYLATRPHKNAIDVVANDFERELFQFKHARRSFQELDRMINQKNDQIDRLQREKEELKRLKDEELTQLSKLYLSTKRELFDWISTVEKQNKLTY